MTLTRPVRAGDTSGMAKSWTFRVKGSSPKLFALTVRAVSELGYSITHSDAASRTAFRLKRARRGVPGRARR
jgi:hypothetical protein